MKTGLSRHFPSTLLVRTTVRTTFRASSPQRRMRARRFGAIHASTGQALRTVRMEGRLGSSTSIVAVMQTRSRTVGMPSGLSLPQAPVRQSTAPRHTSQCSRSPDRLPPVRPCWSDTPVPPDGAMAVRFATLLSARPSGPAGSSAMVRKIDDSVEFHTGTAIAVGYIEQLLRICRRLSYAQPALATVSQPLASVSFPGM